MKNKFLIFFFLISFQNLCWAENISIKSKNITLDKKNETSIFENEVEIITEDNYKIESEYLNYNKRLGILNLKNKIVGTDKRNNIIKSDKATYNKNTQIFKSEGPTTIITSENYTIKGSDVVLNNKDKIINSDNKATLEDLDGNKIYLDNFNYVTEENIFKSIGYIKIDDKKGNSYEFSQIYIDTNKNEIIGTDIKAYINQKDFKIDSRNKPRVFANTIKLNKEKSSFNKSIFTLCDYRKNDKCPPWSIQSTKMTHDSKKKTIYYDNAVIKVYNVPIFYLPKLSHPDPTVERRSGFLPPTISDSKNLGLGVSVPYFWSISRDKNFTLTTNFYASENPLLLGEYHQAFKTSNFLADFGYTEGYKKTSASKKAGEKSHFFSKFTKNFKGKKDSENNLSFVIQDVSNDKYLKLYKIKSNLIDFNVDTLENSLNFVHENNDIFFGLNASIYETLKDDYNDKYEYIFPEVIFDKNLYNDELYGNLDLQTNLKVHNYDTNKLTTFLTNDFNWSSRQIFLDNGINNKILGNFKNVNYEVKNVDGFKEDITNEFHSAIGLLSQVNLQKIKGDIKHLLTPKFLLRYAPTKMRNEETGSRLDPAKAFNLNRLDNVNNSEAGLSGTLGLDYKIKNDYSNFDFSLAQVINEKENSKMPSKSSLDEKLSDLVGSAKLDLGKFNLDYKFNVDQNYSDLNYNEIGASVNFDPINFDFDYLQEKKHLGNQEYFKTKIDINRDDGVFSFQTKRNLITDSAEFYNLSYEYTNDCLRAGIVYRREFYEDSELEAENSLMFKITLTPFGSLNSPSFNQ